jgi:SAF domain-containing protein
MIEYLSARWGLFLATAIYVGAVVVLATWVVSPRMTNWTGDKISYRAVAELRKGHRLTPRDIVLPEQLPGELYWRLPAAEELLGKYLTQAVKRGDAIRRADYALRPDLQPQRGSVPIVVPMHSELVDVDSLVDVCGPDGCVATSLRVMAIITDEGAARGVLEVPISQRGAVQAELEKGRFQVLLQTL